MDIEDAGREPAAPGPAPRLLATLCFTAEKDFLALARSTATHVAGLLGLPFGRANDLRLAVDEACSLFLSGGGGGTGKTDGGTKGGADDGASGGATGGADGRTSGGVTGRAKGPGGGLALVFAEAGGELRVTVSGPTPAVRPDLDGLGWMVLCALVDEPRWEVDADVGILTLREPIPLPH